MAPRIAARRAQKTIYLAYFYSAPLAWFCSAVDTAAQPATQVHPADAPAIDRKQQRAIVMPSFER